jgi:transposase-like protein
LTTAGPVELEVPRDRNATLTAAIVGKRRRRLCQVDEVILSLRAACPVTPILGSEAGDSASRWG